MDRHSILAVLVVALAGCSAVGGVEDPTTTATPAAVPDANASQPGVVPPPPGVSDGRVTDADELVTAHERALDGVAYRFRKRAVERGPNGSIRTEVSVRASIHNGSVFRYDRETVRPTGPDGGNESFSVYADGTRQYVRTDGETGVRYQATPITDTVVGDIDAVLGTRLTEVNASVERVSTDAGPRFLLVAGEGNATLRAVVRSDGLIERLSTTLPVEDATVTYRGRVEVGPTSVEAPDWLPTARNRTDSPPEAPDLPT